MIDKLKNEQRIGRITFLVAWLVISFIGVFIFHFLFSFWEGVIGLDIQTDEQLWNISFSAISFIQFALVGFLQSIAMYRLWGIRIRHWWWVTGVGFVVGLHFSNFVVDWILSLLDSPPTLEVIIILGSTIGIGILGFMQAWLLKSHLSRVYLYVLVLLCTPLINIFIWANVPQLLNLYDLLYAVSTGLILLWLDHITYKNADDNISVAEVES